MGLANSLLTTAVIAGLVWAAAIYQPSANAIETKASNLVIEQSPQKTPQPVMASSHKKESEQKSEKAKIIGSRPQDIQISGITMRLSLDNTAPLWQAFEQATQLHNQLSQHPKQLYISYYDFDQDYGTATVTIGYNTKLLSTPAKPRTLALSKFKTLLVQSDYTNEELKTGWQKINYNATLNSVLEIHQLNGQGQPVATELLVAYR